VDFSVQWVIGAASAVCRADQQDGVTSDLLMTAIAMPSGMSCTVALMVRPLVQGIGFVFVTGRPHLLDTAGNPRDKAFIKPVDLAQTIRHRLAE
jgi:hypothetical protein